MTQITSCPYCNHTKLYDLQDEYKKCISCKKKFSSKKVLVDYKIMEFFCNNITANSCSNTLSINYRTVKDRYNIFRRLITNYLQEKYEVSTKEDSSYEEFYYFTKKQKEKKTKSLYEAINIIGFYSNKKIFTLLMPKLPRYNNKKDEKEFENYLKWHKIYSKKSYKTPLNIFWEYLEENLKKYKGLDEKNFFFYLKECEFKFNYLQNKQIDILKNIYFQ